MWDLRQAPYGFIADEQYQNFKESNQALTDLVQNGEIKNYKSDEVSISFEFDDIRYSAIEIVRADLNDDEIEDIFVSINTGINNASYRGNANLVLIKKSDSDKISEFKKPKPCENLESDNLRKCLTKIYSTTLDNKK